MTKWKFSRKCNLRNKEKMVQDHGQEESTIKTMGLLTNMGMWDCQSYSLRFKIWKWKNIDQVHHWWNTRHHRVSGSLILWLGHILKQYRNWRAKSRLLAQCVGNSNKNMVIDDVTKSEERESRENFEYLKRAGHQNRNQYAKKHFSRGRKLNAH